MSNDLVRFVVSSFFGRCCSAPTCPRARPLGMRPVARHLAKLLFYASAWRRHVGLNRSLASPVRWLVAVFSLFGMSLVVVFASSFLAAACVPRGWWCCCMCQTFWRLCVCTCFLRHNRWSTGVAASPVLASRVRQQPFLAVHAAAARNRRRPTLFGKAEWRLPARARVCAQRRRQPTLKARAPVRQQATPWWRAALQFQWLSHRMRVSLSPTCWLTEVCR